MINLSHQKDDIHIRGFAMLAIFLPQFNLMHEAELTTFGLFSFYPRLHTRSAKKLVVLLPAPGIKPKLTQHHVLCASAAPSLGRVQAVI